MGSLKLSAISHNSPSLNPHPPKSAQLRVREGPSLTDYVCSLSTIVEEFGTPGPVIIELIGAPLEPVGLGLWVSCRSDQPAALLSLVTLSQPTQELGQAMNCSRAEKLISLDSSNSRYKDFKPIYNNDDSNYKLNMIIILRNAEYVVHNDMKRYIVIHSRT